MAITPQDIEQQTFSPSKHGYDTEQVDSFLETVSTEVDAMLQKIADLKSRLTASEQELAATRAELAEASERANAAQAAADKAAAQAPVLVTTAADGTTVSATERQISQALIVAQQSADRVVAEARESAERIRNDADAKAREVIRQALAEKQNELDEIDRLKQSREDFRAQYKSLLQHFIDDADAVFPNITLSSPSGSLDNAAQANPVTDSSDFGDLD